MSKKQKRLQKLRQNAKNVSFDEIQQVLIDYGFYLSSINGSHHVFKAHEGDTTFRVVIPLRKPIKPVYVDEVLQTIDAIELLRQSNKTSLDEQDAGDEDD